MGSMDSQYFSLIYFFIFQEHENIKELYIYRDRMLKEKGHHSLIHFKEERYIEY